MINVYGYMGQGSFLVSKSLIGGNNNGKDNGKNSGAC